MSDQSARRGIRRQPSPMRPVAVESVRFLTPRMARVSFNGEELQQMKSPQPAASVRLLLPSSGSTDLPQIVWDGNVYRLEDGSRPIIRTFTPIDFEAAAGRLHLEVVIHEGGAVSSWVASAAPGDVAALSDPGRGYSIDREADAYLLAGDETALPAIRQLIAAMPPNNTIQAMVELTHPEARLALPTHRGLQPHWVIRQQDDAPGSALLPAIERATIDPDTTIWAAGEAGAMHGVRQLLLNQRGFDRRRITVRGYWKHGR